MINCVHTLNRQHWQLFDNIIFDPFFNNVGNVILSNSLHSLICQSKLNISYTTVVNLDKRSEHKHYFEHPYKNKVCL